jgi:hypothetical protein
MSSSEMESSRHSLDLAHPSGRQREARRKDGEDEVSGGNMDERQLAIIAIMKNQGNAMI